MKWKVIDNRREKVLPESYETETEALNEDNGYIDNKDEVVMAQDGFFEESLKQLL